MKSPASQSAGIPESYVPLPTKLAASRMSTFSSRFVSPGAAKATRKEPSPLSSQPTARIVPAARSAAADDDVMPLVPFQPPLPRPSTSRATSTAGVIPDVIVTCPVVTSTSPPEARSRAPTVADRKSATPSVAPAATCTVPVERAVACPI